MTFILADRLLFEPRAQISRIFTEGFYQWLRYFSSDKAKLARAFEHMFDLSKFHVAADGGKIAAIAALTDGKTAPIKLRAHHLRRHLGLLRGIITYLVLKNQLQEHKYPFEIADNVGSIEFVASAPEYRGKGAAFALISHIMSTALYNEFILEVADTNTPAVRLYEKLGFSEFHRVKEPHSKQSNVNFLVYMLKKIPRR
ncbi:MAG: GNAT family N-acetyltransferase [Clostridiales bacterium]|nr:GNAT family N-acetyltransferase [Clostridiales bacterium]